MVGCTLFKTSETRILSFAKAIKKALGADVFQPAEIGEALGGGEARNQTFLQRLFQFGRGGERVSFDDFLLPAIAVENLVLHTHLETLGGDELDAGEPHVLTLHLLRVGIVTVELQLGSKRAQRLVSSTLQRMSLAFTSVSFLKVRSLTALPAAR